MAEVLKGWVAEAVCGHWKVEGAEEGANTPTEERVQPSVPCWVRMKE